MFGKLIPGVGGSAQKDISKDINESVKTLSYLARAEKYFDLELKKDGKVTKPLLRIVDVIEPLRKIFALSQKLEKGTAPEQFEINALNSSDEIVEVVNDILSLSPKGLVSSDKVVLAKLGSRLDELKKITAKPADMPAKPVEEVKPKKQRNKAYSGKLFGQKIAVREENDEKPEAEENEEPPMEIPDSFFEYKPTPEPVAVPEPESTSNITPLPPQRNIVDEWIIPEPETELLAKQLFEPDPGPQLKVISDPDSKPQPEPVNIAQDTLQINDESFWSDEKLEEPLDWDLPTPRPIMDSQLDVNEAAVEEDAPIVQEYYESGVHEPAPPPVENVTPHKFQSMAHAEEIPTPAQDTPKPVRTYNLPQKYFATSYAGMNLQEAAEIIADLASNPANKDIVLMEHSSSVKPVKLGNEIIGDLLAIAPIADSFETGSEITDKAHLAVLNHADKIISICRDIANIKVDGFDKRKQKLFEKFLQNDIRKTTELAKIAYPEFFSSADTKGEITSNSLLDFADVILEFASETGDKLFAELMSQIVVQIALYAEHNDLRLKFDLVTKKNKLHAETQKLESRSEIAALRSVTFVPKIARHAQDVLSADSITDKQNFAVDKALEILQLIYVHARDNYSAEMQNFYTNKPA